MDTMNIALPAPLKDFVRDQVRAGGYSSSSEYVRELIRRDQERRQRSEAWKKVERLLLDGASSGTSEAVTPEFWQRLRSEVLGGSDPQ